MKRLATGIVIAAVVLYFFGFLWWGGLIPYQSHIWEQAVDEERASQFLREQFPRNGTYHVPGISESSEETAQRFESGPVAFVHILAVDGRPMIDPEIMAMGFLNNLVVIVLIAVLLRHVAPAMHSYWHSVQFVTLMGLTAVILLDFGMAVWWEISWSWQCYQALYDLLFFIIAGMILTPFVNVPAETATTAAADEQALPVNEDAANEPDADSDQ